MKFKVGWFSNGEMGSQVSIETVILQNDDRGAAVPQKEVGAQYINMHRYVWLPIRLSSPVASESPMQAILKFIPSLARTANRIIFP